MNHKFSIEALNALLIMEGTILCDITWDIDNDIENDLDSDDKVMKKLANKFQKSGLTEAYLNENIKSISKDFQEGISVVGGRPVNLKANLNSLSLEINSKKLTFSDALKIFKSGALNLNEGDLIYIQGLSYFQLSNFVFQTKGGEKYNIKTWRIIDSINSLVTYQDKIVNRNKMVVIPNSLYLSINDAVIYIKPKRDWGGENPAGVIVTQKDSRCSGYGDEITFTLDGAVAELETVEFLPFHPDSVFALSEVISTRLPDLDFKLFALGNRNVEELDASL